MAKLLTCFLSCSLLGLAVLSVLHAQTPSTAPAAAPSVVANPAPSAQAPDEATKKISDLVHGGKYAEAQKLTEGLLIAYPDDRRLIQAQALIQKLMAAPASPAPAVASAPSAATGSEAAPLTGMDKVDYNALIELARQAQESTDAYEQGRLMGRFMGQSVRFLQKHPEQMLLWRLRAVIAIAANRPMDGYEAGQRLLDAGAADSNDPAMQKLLAQLRNKGWLDRRGAINAQDEALRQRVGEMYGGTWYGKVAAPDNHSPMKGCVDSEINHKCLFYNFVESGQRGEIHPPQFENQRDETADFSNHTSLESYIGNSSGVPARPALKAVSWEMMPAGAAEPRDLGGKIHSTQFEIQSDGTIVVSDRTAFAGCTGNVYGVPVGPAFKDVRWEIRPAGQPARQIYSTFVEDGSQFGFSCNRPQSGEFNARYNYVIWQKTLDAGRGGSNKIQDPKRY
jgi:hypothetical protein